MLEKPDLPDQLLLSRLHEEYGLQVRQLAFLPLGADVNTAVFRVVAEDETVYFLKLRRGDFDEISVALPRFLQDQGIRAIIAPLETRTRRAWADLDEYKTILYPFVEGKDGYEVALTDRQWQDFGATLRGIHTARVPPALARQIPGETYSPHWRDLVRAFQAQVEQTAFTDPTADKLAAFLRSRRGEIARLVTRAEELGAALQARSPEWVLCHADLHAGNLLIGADPAGAGGGLYLVDWDAPLFAPRERDLALIGGCGVWHSRREEALFYQGYNPGGNQVEIDPMALSYYRYERIVVDIAEFCKQLFWTDEGGEDREQSYRYLTGSFLPGHEVEIAFQRDARLAG